MKAKINGDEEDEDYVYRKLPLKESHIALLNVHTNDVLGTLSYLPSIVGYCTWNPSKKYLKYATHKFLCPTRVENELYERLYFLSSKFERDGHLDFR